MRKFFSFLGKIVTAPFRGLWWLIKWPFQPIIKFLNEQPTEQPLGEMLASLVSEKEARESLFKEIEAFRRHLLRAALWLTIGAGISFFFNQQILEYLAGPVGGLKNLTAIEVTESIGVYMKVALMVGAAVASLPVIFEFWLFAAPGLKPPEKKSTLAILPFAAILFVTGMAFSYFVILPNALPFLQNFAGITTQLRPASYFNFVTGLMFWLGVAFEFPILTVILTLMNLVKPKMLLDQWRIAVIVIAALAAIITPTVDPFNMSLVMFPTIGLYFVGVAMSYLVATMRRKSAEREKKIESESEK